MLQCPFNKTLFLQILCRYTWISIIKSITIKINIPIPSNKCMQYSKQKCSIPFLTSVIFLSSNAVYFCRDNIHTKYEVFLQKICPLKEHTMHFHMPNLLLKGAISLFYTNIPAQDAILLTQDILLKSATYLKICDSLGMFFCSLQQRIVLYL